jgi:hypothetical protein
MTDEARAARTRLTRSTRFTYALGGIAFGVKESGLQLFLLLFYGQVLGLSEAWVATGITLALALSNSTTVTTHRQRRFEWCVSTTQAICGPSPIHWTASRRSPSSASETETST